MFPEKLVIDFDEGLYEEIHVLRALRKQIPYFLRWLEDNLIDKRRAKFRVADIVQVQVLTMETHVDEKENVDVWGVGMQVCLITGKYFLLYLPMYSESIFDEAFFYWSEIYNSIEPVEGHVDLRTLKPLREWKRNLYDFQNDEGGFLLTQADF